MSRLPNFVGPSNVLFSRNVDAERTINYIPCVRDAGTPKVQAWLESAPGYKPFCGLGVGPVRALFAQDFGFGDRCFAVGGGVLYELFPSHTAVARGSVIQDGNPATISTNGTAGYQLLIVSGGAGYIFDLTTNVLTLIDPSGPDTGGFPTHCSRGEFCGGFFLALQSNNNVWAFSQAEDGTKWPGLNFIRISEAADDIRAIVVNQFQVWNFGQFTTEVWQLDASTSVFGPVGGNYIEQGIWAPWSAAALDNSIFWLGGNKLGHGMVYRNNGYNPVRISDYAVENAIQRLPRSDDAIAWTYSEAGHSFYELYLPHAETTWVYDVATGLWAERGLWDDRFQRYMPEPGRCACTAWGSILVGDRSTPTVYTISQDYHNYELVVGS